MMKKNISLLIFIAIFNCLQAQPTDWKVNPANYQYSMTVTGTLILSKEIIIQSDDYLAAFHGDECRGLTQPVYEEDMELWVVYLIIYSNEENDEIIFKYFNKENDTIIDILEKIDFKENDILGTLDSLFLLNSLIEESSETGINNCRNQGNYKTTIFPNPSTNRITIRFEGYANNIFNIHIINISGETIKVFDDLDIKDLHILEWEFGNANHRKINSGVYILRFSHNYGIVSKPFIIK